MTRSDCRVRSRNGPPTPCTHGFPSRASTARRSSCTREEGLTKPGSEPQLRDREALAKVAHVVDVSGPFDPRGPTVSPGGRTAFVTVVFDTDEILQPVSRRCRGHQSLPSKPACRWSTADCSAARAGEAKPRQRDDRLAVGVLVLAIAFGSLVAMSLPIGRRAPGLLVGHQLDRDSRRATSPEPSITTIVGTMLGLGVGIDYALFILAGTGRTGRRDARARGTGGPTRQRGCRCCSPASPWSSRIARAAGSRNPDAHDDGLGLCPHGRRSACWRRSRCSPGLLGLVGTQGGTACGYPVREAREGHQ